MAKKKPEGIKIQRTVELKISDKEQAKRARELAKLELEKFEAEQAKKADAHKWNHKIKHLQQEISQLSREVDSGREEQTVTCTLVKDYEGNKVDYYYKDEIVDTREMTDEDRQMDIEETPKKKRQQRKTAKVKRRSKKAAQSEDEPSNVVEMNS